ncbi:AIM24 family protein [Pedobacter sp. R20-19]|uniref:AIM24 family protein n=1 Tax=Pedobacter sp. R20-19 TaxID=1270196 RepID=UPI0004939D49|nr:AIM24 family protein [Pedobacter sp. R20-19]NTD96817.1 AIM24 family protein [Agrobacterium tumefaciens]NTE18796.1 AIM24 family protein [Agrobacterium tumefaciens]
METKKEYTLKELIHESAEDPNENDFFELEKPALLEVNLRNQKIMAKAGSMVAYIGNVDFKREGLLSKGLGGLLKKAISGEGTSLMHAAGTGKLYLADEGKKVKIIKLQNESVFVNGNDVLALEDSIKNEIKMLKSVAGMMSGGLFQVKLSGSGYIAITTHGEPILLRVSANQPVYTDPNATVAWSENLSPNIKTNLTFGSFIGRGSGESFQLEFFGEGWVLVQPYEEVKYAQK